MEGERRMLNKLLVSLIFGMLLSTQLASAVYFSAPSQVNLNENFNIAFSGSGFYCLELYIPNNFILISDSVNGALNNGVYKPCSGTNFVSTFRATEPGTYTITGIYSSDSGVMNFNPKTIIVKEQQTTPTCPTCPSATSWSNCENNQQIKYVYSCSLYTNYQCVQSIETQSCQIETTGGSSSNSNPTCEVGWICKDENNLAYQSSDCSLSSVQKCSEGCENKECKVKQEIKDKFPEENLTIEIDPPSVQETPQSFFDKIGSLIRKIIDFLIFWR